VEQSGGDRVHVLVTLRPLARIMPSQGSSTCSTGCAWAEALLGLPENLLQPVPDTANRSLTLAETEMLRNLNVEFRGNGLPDELYSRLVRGGAVPHMKNACSPTPRDVKIPMPRRAVEAACATGAGAALARSVHQTSSKELVRVLGHRCPKRLRRRRTPLPGTCGLTHSKFTGVHAARRQSPGVQGE
jgi:hypothetical protein